MKVVIVGAGVIGALIGYRLAQSGAEVTILEAGRPAGAASGASFGWINASFYADADHFRLRHAAIEAHRRLQSELGSDAATWPGCLCWEEKGAAFDTRHDALRDLGYDVREVDAAEFRRLEPEVTPPDRALRFGAEGAVDLPTLTRDALQAGHALGLRLVCGVRVTGVRADGDRISGVETTAGRIDADRVIVASGTGTQALLETAGVPLPMLDRPGLILRSQPLPQLVSHVLVTPDGEVRQLPDGCFLSPTAAAHQQVDTASDVTDPRALADAAAARLSQLLNRAVHWEQVTLAQRPVPQGGLPAIGPCGSEGLYVATLHSGATLAPLVAELVAAEVADPGGLGNDRARMLAPYRPDRFKG
ncbi:FAD-dependent oxidoreductase [Sulfitobacter sp. D35]|uniref:NAD(P)/FAD-dependent oxidoreductase n=1 Tax=Sulfitobacter sp. D35 TaxID=3083252 RepID=UPI00296ED6CD|nr:FAD-dependent oxidoreductase [Sulfitobacter sp. D35]MDW4497599.1 FAD-dependent oxidoreductase [Sulfitobacter sp. D35]